LVESARMASNPVWISPNSRSFLASVLTAVSKDAPSRPIAVSEEKLKPSTRASTAAKLISSLVLMRAWDFLNAFMIPA